MFSFLTSVSVMAAPLWFNETFLLQIINAKTQCSTEIQIIDSELIPGLSSGENHCSVIYRSNVQFKWNGTKQRQYFIIKAPLVDGVLKQITEEGKFIEKEFMLYSHFFPTADDLIGNLGICPNYFPSKLESVLVLEDLRMEGYAMRDKYRQLDFEHSLMVMKTLATFHAVSVAVHKKDPSLVLSIGEAYVFKGFDNTGFSFMKDKLLHFGNAVENWKGFERFGNKIRRIYETCNERLHEVVNNRRGFNVLNHGDLWTNNILFKYDEKGNVKDVKLIDFQICMYGSFGIDLQFFAWTSIQNDVRIQRMDELYTVYLQTLNTYLEKLGCEERINENMIKKEINFTMFFGFFAVFCCLNVIFTDEDDKNSERSVYDKSCYKEKAQQILIYLENNGFFK